jgi:hypothetical protein
MKSSKTSWGGALLIVSVFLGVIGYGLVYGILNLKMGSPGVKAGATVIEVRTAPTVEQYHLAAGEVMGPFLRLAFDAAEGDTPRLDEELLTAARSAESMMLDLRVPKDERQAHLEAILLLNQWARAANGSRADARQVAGNTFRLVEKWPWFYR